MPEGGGLRAHPCGQLSAASRIHAGGLFAESCIAAVALHMFENFLWNLGRYDVCRECPQQD